MQDIAGEHWNSVATDKLKRALLWMIKRHEIDYFNQAFLGDQLVMETWTGDFTNVTWKRHYEIIRPADNKKIISASSVWIPFDRKTQRPRRVDEGNGNDVCMISIHTIIWCSVIGVVSCE
jgi:acyl-CoA thioester hydrolase